MKPHEAVAHCSAAIDAAIAEATRESASAANIWRLAASERLDRIIALEDILADCWGQFSCEMEDGWMNDGALSTLDCIAEVLVKAKRLERHPTRQWYRWTGERP